ncbi:MAG: hypothetical protein Unbinned2902contig1001_27 [Prokaryotic dsDNA virus sp.]|nr:MAG: hypothetical protein Unbinned2902contig1001_27 [Prokaryotic dsDNA virus sp.]
MNNWEKYKFLRKNKIRICKMCNKIINNHPDEIHKRTQFCSDDCVEDYKFEKCKRKLTSNY